MIKNLVPALSKKQEDEKKEGYRRLALQSLAAVAGFVITLVAQEQIRPILFKTEG